METSREFPSIEPLPDRGEAFEALKAESGRLTQAGELADLDAGLGVVARHHA